MKQIWYVMRSPISTRCATVAASLVLLAAPGYWGGKLIFVHVYADEPINVKPYVMTYDSIVVHGGVEKVVERSPESRRHDGAIHNVGTHYGNSPKDDLTSRRVDFPDGTAAAIVDSIHAKSTIHKPKADLAREIDKTFFGRVGPDCLLKGIKNETVDGTDTLFDYSAVRLIRSSPIAGKDGLSREVDWRLPEFNCASVQFFLQIQDHKTGEWKTTMGNRLTSISATEPDPDIFTNWLNYDEMRPSDIKRRIGIARGETPQTCPGCFSPDPSDVNYRKWHQN